MDEKPKRKDINKYVKPFATHKWYDIGLELEVGDDEGFALDEIREKCRGDKEDCFDCMIGKWLKEADKSQLTWRVLISCLSSLKLDKAVKSIQENVHGVTSQDEQQTSGKECSTEKKQLKLDVEATPIVNTGGPLCTTDENAMKCENHPITDHPNSSFDSAQVAKGIKATTTKQETSDKELIPETQKSSSELPLAVEGPPLPPHKDMTTDYTLVLENGRRIRGYQKELAEPGIKGRNYIVVAPTGSGKTLVAAQVIADHLQKGKVNDEERRVVFIVEKRPLAQQQTKELQDFIPAAQVACCIGDDTNNTVKSSIDSGHHIIVCTAGKLLDDHKSGRVSLADFTLIVFDECHHTRKKSPYVGLMLRYIQMKFEGKKLPQVMGLTASPGAGDNPHLEKTVTIDHLVNLCALMDATSGIKTVRENKEELEEHTNKPEYNLEDSKDRDLNEPFIVKVVTLMQELEKVVEFTCPFNRWSQKYETHIQQKKFVLEKSTDPSARNDIRVWELLRCLSRALDVYMELQYEDAISVLNGCSLLKLNTSTANDFEMKLHTHLNILLADLKDVKRVDNPHLLRVKCILEERFQKEPQSKVMLFVRTKKHASSIFNWISGLDVAAKLGIHPCVVVGQQAGTTGEGMTQTEQENSFKKFRDGRSNLLVVTSIGEEGIDVPACNLVLRYQHVSNEIAKAQTLGRARATGVSEGYTILSSTSKQKQEVKNAELLALVDDILRDSHFPSGGILLKKIKEEQTKILQKDRLEKEMIEKKRSTYNAADVQLLCIICKIPACCAVDIRVINGNCYVVPGEEFKQKIKMVEISDKPQYKQAMNRTHNIHCKSCNAPWGNSSIWPHSGKQFPVLSCKRFLFTVRDCPITVKKWSDAPFTLKEIDA